LPVIGNVFHIKDFEGSGSDLVIEVCDVLHDGRVRLSIHVAQTGKSMCNGDISAPPSMDLPSTNPSTNPSNFPTTTTPSISPSDSPSVHPSFEPTSVAPTSFPSFIPSQAPSFNFCNDKPGFFSPDGIDLISCDTLSRNRPLKAIVCVPSHIAYHHCEDTCGACSDNCEDSPGDVFFVNRRHGYKNCLWLSVRPAWQHHLCKEGHSAFDMCGETCNNPKCEKQLLSQSPSVLKTNQVPSLTPSLRIGSTSMAPTTCEDSADADFFVDKYRGRRKCVWLARAASTLQDRLCTSTEAGSAREVCPELCGTCQDTCHDDDQALIYIHKSIGYKTCRWLSIRPGPAGRVCQRSSDARRFCGETCDSCGSNR